MLLVLALVGLRASAQSDPLDRWNLRRESHPLLPSLSDSLRAVAFGANRWVAVGNGGSIITTPDPASVPWSVQRLDSQPSMLDLIFAEGLFVAVGASGAILTSSDGSTWQRQESGVSRPLHQIVYTASQFIAVGEGSILTSPDARTWTPHNTPPGGLPTESPARLTGIAYGNGSYVAAAGGLWQSTDLNTWRSVSYSAFIWGITFHDGLFVAVGHTSGPRTVAIMTSTDAVNWDTQIINVHIEVQYPELRRVIHDGNRFVAVGGGVYWESNLKSLVLTSPDGRQWTEQETTGRSPLLSVAVGHGQWVAVGSGSNGPIVFPNIVMMSHDSGSWAVVSEPPKLAAVQFANDSFLAVGNSGTILRSNDGVLWQTAMSGTTSDLSDIASSGNVTIAIGTFGTILRSSNGIDWTRQISPTRVHLTGAVFAQGLFVVVGGFQVTAGDGTLAAAPRALLSSPDGITWSEHKNVSIASLIGDDSMNLATSGIAHMSWTSSKPVIPARPPQPPTSGSALYDVAFGAGRFVAVGGHEPRVQPSSRTILSSIDGKTWSGRGVFNSTLLRGVTFGNGLFVAVDSVSVISSQNATAWNQVFFPFPSVVHKVGFGGNTFVVVGTNGLIETSPTATNWVVRKSGTVRGLHGMAFGRDTFVVVGEAETILQSDPLNSAPSLEPRLLNPSLQSGTFSVFVPTESGRRYILESADQLPPPAWTQLMTITGDGTLKILTDSNAHVSERFYRVRVSNGP